MYIRLSGVYGPHVLCYSQVANWFKQSRLGRESIIYEPRYGRQRNAVTIDKIAVVESMIMNDRRVEVSAIEAEMSILIGCVEKNNYEHLAMSEVSARWVPTQAFKDIYTRNPEDFISQLVTRDETKIHYWEPESKLKYNAVEACSFAATKKFQT